MLGCREHTRRWWWYRWCWWGWWWSRCRCLSCGVKRKSPLYSNNRAPKIRPSIAQPATWSTFGAESLLAQGLPDSLWHVASVGTHWRGEGSSHPVQDATRKPPCTIRCRRPVACFRHLRIAPPASVPAGGLHASGELTLGRRHSNSCSKVVETLGSQAIHGFCWQQNSTSSVLDRGLPSVCLQGPQWSPSCRQWFCLKSGSSQ